ncbi:MAG: hypothetical protein NC206_10345 [Bacteroides sp.]|nr:hypothetical protein [Roseburia sp.]MCM1347467.1 hypothetical protein [Bacteroides sp.]MCM1421320.1 hypothetical protein [Bacteroides sp.]
MKRILQNIALTLITFFAVCLHHAEAQVKEVAAPKWVAKNQKAIFSLLTYDKEGNLLHSGTGFYIGNGGEAVADYNLFRDAYKATAMDMNGTKSEVTLILGADDTYGLVRFLVGTKKNAVLTPAQTPAQTGSPVWIVSYSNRKIATCPTATISDTSSVSGKYPYYTLSEEIGDNYIGSPVFNTSGELVGIVQHPSSKKGYALGIAFAEELKIQAISSKSATLALSNIHLRKGLPESMEEALVYLYFKSRSAGNEEYIDLLNQFVTAYPNNAEGYFRRSTPLTDMQRFDEADSDLQNYLRLAEDKVAANANVAQAIQQKLVYQPEAVYEKWNFDVALGYIDKAIELEKNRIATNGNEKSSATLLDCQLRKTQILMSKKDYDAAIAIYNELNGSEHRAPAIYYASALAHAGRGDSLSIQIEMLDSALALFPDPLPAEAATYVLYRGKLYEEAGRYREAVVDYDKFCYLSNNKVNAAFYYDRSQVEIKARMYQQALDDLNAAIALAPRESLYHVEKSALLLRVNQIDGCIEAAKECVSLNPQQPDAYRIMGYAYLQKGDKAEAKKNLERAKELGDETAQEIMNQYMK